LGDLCELAGRDVSETDEGSSVSEIIITATMAETLVGNSELKNLGFTKLENRYNCACENFTRTALSKIFSIPRAQVRCHIVTKKSAIIVEKRPAIGGDLSKTCRA